MTAGARGVVATVLVLCAGAVGGCGGGSQQPGDAVPALRAAVHTVDAALAGHDVERARRALERLVALTSRAREDGRISATQADRVLAAVARLVTALPDPGSVASPTPSLTPSPAPRTPGAGGEKKGQKKGQKKDEHRGHGPGKGHGDEGSAGPSRSRARIQGV